MEKKSTGKIDVWSCGVVVRVLEDGAPMNCIRLPAAMILKNVGPLEVARYVKRNYLKIDSSSIIKLSYGKMQEGATLVGDQWDEEAARAVFSKQTVVLSALVEHKKTKDGESNPVPLYSIELSFQNFTTHIKNEHLSELTTDTATPNSILEAARRLIPDSEKNSYIKLKLVRRDSSGVSTVTESRLRNANGISRNYVTFPIDGNTYVRVMVVKQVAETGSSIASIQANTAHLSLSSGAAPNVTASDQYSVLTADVDAKSAATLTVQEAPPSAPEALKADSATLHDEASSSALEPTSFNPNLGVLSPFDLNAAQPWFDAYTFRHRKPSALPPSAKMNANDSFVQKTSADNQKDDSIECGLPDSAQAIAPAASISLFEETPTVDSLQNPFVHEPSFSSYEAGWTGHMSELEPVRQNASLVSPDVPTSILDHIALDNLSSENDLGYYHLDSDL